MRAEFLLRALVDDPGTTHETHLDARFALGSCLADTGRFEEAQAICAQLRRAAAWAQALAASRAAGSGQSTHDALTRLAGNRPPEPG